MRHHGFFVGLFLLACNAAALAQSLPAGFQRTDPISGRTQPSGVYFAHDGRVFVTEKSGLIWVYDNLLDSTPQVFADLTANVHNFWDRGLLGFALDPRFPEQPYVYVQYAYNGGLFADAAPRWPGTNCPSPPGPTSDNGGCVISGRVSRFTVSGNSAGSELVLVEDWYQQYPSHSIGTVLFGPDGYLYAGGGDGASFNWADWGQRGNPDFPDQRAPLNQGGALRAQGLEIEAQYSGSQVWLSGSVIRIDPASGAAAPANPLAASGLSENARRIIAYGLRNPFRFTVRPGTGELWVGDVGWSTWEEINRIPALPDDGSASLQNFGWPCFEGRVHTGGYGTSNLAICNALYANGNTGGRTPWTQPWYTYQHQGSSDTTGLAFYEGTSYPAQYQNSLFLADNSRTVIFNIPFVDANADGIPDAPADSAATAFFGGSLAKAVQLTSGPGKDIFYANLEGNRISRLSYCNGCSNLAPSAAIALDGGSTADGAPRTIGFSAANSVDPNGDALTYMWDLDDDGNFDDGVGPAVSAFFTASGSYRVAVQVSDNNGGVDVASMLITVANVAPTVTMISPTTGTHWSAGEIIPLTAIGDDPNQGPLPDSAMTWDVYRDDCIDDFSNCTESLLGHFTGSNTSFIAPDAAYPAYLRVVLTGTDDGGLTDSEEVSFFPDVTNLTLDADPSSMMVAFAGEAAQPPPITRTVIVNASVGVSAPTPQLFGPNVFEFASWSDGGAADHVVHVGSLSPMTLVASFIEPADIAVAVDDGLGVVNTGQLVTWILTIDNLGVNPLWGVALHTTLPPTLTNVQWTCTATGGSNCTASGSGAPSDVATLEIAGRLTYTISATVAVNASGSITLSANVTLPEEFFNVSPENDSASDTDSVFSDVIFRDGFETPN